MPLVTSKEGALLGAEYRQLDTLGETTLGGSIARTSDAEPDADGDSHQVWRGHVEGEGRYRLDENRPFGFDLALASDDTYLDRYDFSSEDVLENRAFFEEHEDRNLLSLDLFAFQGLREDDDQGLIPVVAPWVRSHKVSDRGPGGSFFFGNTSILSLTRMDGLDTRRLSGEAGWQLPHVGRFGELMTFETSLRGDLYSVDGAAGDRASQSGRETVARIVPRATFDLSWPLVGNSHGWSQVVEPILSASWTANDVNKRDIPNEDSLVFEFDETNLFEPDRFTGLDKVESGAKLSYGMRFDAIGPSGLRVSGVVGQSVREGADRLFADGSGLEESLSDYVGRFDFRPGSNFDMSYRFRLAKDELTFRRSDLSLRFGPPRLRFNLQYLQLTEDLPDSEFKERQEVVAGMRLQVTDRLAVGTQFRRDLTLDRPVTNTYGILFSDPCLSILAGLEQNFTEKGELEDETRFSVRVTFRSLGDLEADSTLF
ncbi:MAG: LPS-assembly protein LptD [Geminicoccaceae bacterium]